MRKHNLQLVRTTTKQADKTQMTGDDKDAHGCIGSAGYSWSELKINAYACGSRYAPEFYKYC